MQENEQPKIETSGCASLSISGPITPGSFIFSGSAGAILTITSDGRLERGEVFASDDEASVAFFDCLAKNLPGYLAALRHRAETAERKLAELTAGSH